MVSWQRVSLLQLLSYNCQAHAALEEETPLELWGFGKLSKIRITHSSTSMPSLMAHMRTHTHTNTQSISTDTGTEKNAQSFVTQNLFLDEPARAQISLVDLGIC